MSGDLPYCVEYAKSNRSSCRACRGPIQKDSLRIATLVQSTKFDGKQTNWYHSNCFFIKQRPKSTDDISNFDNVRWEDQESIKKSIENCASLPPPAGGKKGRKRAAAKTVPSGSAPGEFRVEYAKSGKSSCRGCEDKIPKGEIRVSKKDYESEEARRFGGMDAWHHLNCFVQLRQEYQFFEPGITLSGIKILSKEDQKIIKDALPKIDGENAPPVLKKLKEDPEDREFANNFRIQNERLFELKNKLNQLKRKELEVLCTHNKQKMPSGTSEIFDFLSDVIYFGALVPCEKCKGQLVYNSGIGYKCTGHLEGDWVQCENVVQEPKRKKFKFPKEIEEFSVPDLLTDIKTKVQKRIFKLTPSSTSTSIKKEDEVDSGPKIKGPPKPLKHMNFVIVGCSNKDALKKEIFAMGGDVVGQVNANTAAVIATEKEIEKDNKPIRTAREFNIHVVSEDFVDEAKQYTEPPIALIKNKSICTWGGDPTTRINKSISIKSSSRGKSKYEKQSSGTVKLQVKGGGTVDPDSKLEGIAHIYEDGPEKYTATLCLTDIQTGVNKYYKIQILQHDKEPRTTWVFRNWGRIGTTIGGTKLDRLPLDECIKLFEAQFLDKSGNHWVNRKDFVKKPGLMYLLDIDHGLDDDSSQLESDIQCSLQKPVQDLIRLIFDVANMKKVMLEFEIDMDKMPLGKLSKAQLQNAYRILNELLELIKQGTADRPAMIGASNRFYTLIPHNFGISGAKILDCEEDIKMKCQMIDSLLEMEIAYTLLHSSTDKSKNPLDNYYEKLNTTIDVVDKSSEEYKIIQEYVQNTHAATHSQYKLIIEEVFVINRKGEEQRFKPFKKLKNRKLLWHGSRTTNYAGILSQGLRIAPPEAPVTGYMFGKGIYFADMVSKSANYCCTNSQNRTGLLMLCEVALGNMYERYHADYIEKLPKGKHSTKGVGKTQPDPKKIHVTKDGLEIPYGKGVSADGIQQSSLLYNEYIVYDVAQVKAKYLIKMHFEYGI